MIGNKKSIVYFFKFIPNLALSIIALFFIIIFFLAFLLDTDYAKERISIFVSNSVQDSLGYTLEIRDLHVDLPLRVYIGELKISDNKGVWCEARSTKINISLISLFTSNINIQSLVSDYINLIRTPERLNEKDDTKVKKDFNLSINNIKVAQAIINPDISKLPDILNAQLQANMLWQEKDKRFNFDIQLKLTDDVTEIAFKKAEVRANGYYLTEQNVLCLTSSSVNSNIISSEGSAVINFANAPIKGEYIILLKNFDKIEPAFDKNSILKFKLNFSGTPNLLKVIAELETKDIKYQATALPDSTLVCNATINLKNQTASITATTPNDHTSINTNFIVNKDKILTFNNIMLITDKLSLQGNGAWDISSNLIDGEIRMSSSDLSFLSEILHTKVKGTGSAQIKFFNMNLQQKCLFTADLKNLISDYASIERAHAEIKITDLKQLKVEQAELKLTGIRSQEQVVDDVKISVVGREKGWVINTQCNQNKKAQSFNLEGFLLMNSSGKDEIFINILNLTGNLGQTKITTRNAIDILYSDTKIRCAIKDLQIGTGYIKFDGEINNDLINSKFLFKEMPLLIMYPQIHTIFKNSKVTGNVELNGTITSPKIISHLNVTNLSLNKTTKNATLVLDTNFKENYLQLNSYIQDIGRSIATANIVLPINASLSPLTFELDRNKTIDCKIVFNSAIDQIASTLLPITHNIVGTLYGVIVLKGTINTPKVDVNLNFNKGEYINNALGIKLQKIFGTVKSRNGTTVLSEVKAYDNQNNVLSCSGEIEINKPNAPFSFLLSTNKFNLFNHVNIRGSINAGLHLQGNTNEASITGSLETNTLEINLPERFQTSAPSLNIVDTIPKQDEEQYKHGSFFESYPILIKISASVKNQAFIRGWGLNAELGGDLKISGNINKPGIEGKLNILRGRYEEFGKKLYLKDSFLMFEGDIPPSPYLDIHSWTTVDSTEIRLVLSGPLLRPELSIESTPDLPPEEALARLLFGKESKNISAFQAIQLVDSLQRLTGKDTRTFNASASARSLLHVDDINIKNSGTGMNETAIGIGKHLTDKIYLEIEQGAQSESGKSRIELELTPNISLEGLVGGNDFNAIIINWKKDY